MMNCNFQETRVGVSLAAKLWCSQSSSGLLFFVTVLQVGRRGKFVAGLLEKAVGDQGVERGNNKPMVSASYECTTIDMEMRRLLWCRGLLTKHYKDEFQHSEGDSPGPRYGGSRLGFYLPLYGLEAGFHLPFDAFMCELVNAYGVAPEQLS
ncbi:hypothetical protein CXB51_018980 [Gossypium anomalum]|uniref:Uncharacterized protein n=1 Tax=Gossypium anomalum TaxID=47600 RepID=A0A8J5YN24_9ROSI|nr:hypothetical protein CXB51_018980 [Gossypium anomalum]